MVLCVAKVVSALYFREQNDVVFWDLPRRNVPLQSCPDFARILQMDTVTPSGNAPKDLTITHDRYFREVFQMKRIAQAFLKKGLPKKTIEVLDLDGLTVDERYLTDDMFKERTADVIYQVPVKGTEEHVNFFVVVEHKSATYFWTLFQLWGYVYRICLREFRAAEDRGEVKAGYRLPPVIAIIVHHGDSRFRGETELMELFVSLPGLEGYLPKMQAILFDLSTIADDDEIMNDPEVPELKVVLLVLKTIFRSEVPLTLEDVLRELKPYSDDPEIRRIIRATWIYLNTNAEYLHHNIEALLGTFTEVIGEEEMTTMIEVWEARGEAKAGRDYILAILREKFNCIPTDTEQAILAMSDPIALKSWAVQAATCYSIEEFSEAVK